LPSVHCLCVNLPVFHQFQSSLVNSDCAETVLSCGEHGASREHSRLNRCRFAGAGADTPDPIHHDSLEGISNWIPRCVWGNASCQPRSVPLRKVHFLYHDCPDLHLIMMSITYLGLKFSTLLCLTIPPCCLEQHLHPELQKESPHGHPAACSTWINSSSWSSCSV